jgi:hypothetical protein
VPRGDTILIDSPPGTPFSCMAADDVGTPTGSSFDVDASCKGGRDLNLADVLGGGLLSMYGYDCVNEEPQNCLTSEHHLRCVADLYRKSEEEQA